MKHKRNWNVTEGGTDQNNLELNIIRERENKNNECFDSKIISGDNGIIPISKSRKKRDKNCDLSAVEEHAYVYDSEFICTNKQRKIHKNDIYELNHSDVYTDFNNYNPASIKSYKMKHKKENDLNTIRSFSNDENLELNFISKHKIYKNTVDLDINKSNINLNDVEIDSLKIKHKREKDQGNSNVLESTNTMKCRKKQKRNKERDFLNNSESLAHFDNLESNYTKKQKRKYKRKEEIGSNIETCLISDGYQSVSNDLKGKHKKNLNLEGDIGQYNSELNIINEYQNKNECFDSDNMVPNNNEIVPCNKNIYKYEENCDLNTIEDSSYGCHSELNCINKQKQRHGNEIQELNHIGINTGFNNYEVAFTKKHKKKHKKENLNIVKNCTNDDNLELTSKKKHKKCKNTLDLSTDINSVIVNNSEIEFVKYRKQQEKGHDLNITKDCTNNYNLVLSHKKHKRIFDLNTDISSINFNSSEVECVNKYKKKCKESRINSSERHFVFPNADSNINKCKHKKGLGFTPSSNQFDNSETNFAKNCKENDSSIIEHDFSDLSFISNHKKKHKIHEGDHGLSIIEEYSINDKITSNKYIKHKKDNEDIVASNSDLSNSELNLRKKHKKKHKKDKISHSIRTIQPSLVSDSCETTSTMKHRNKHKKKRNKDFNNEVSTETGANNTELNFIEKSKNDNLSFNEAGSVFDITSIISNDEDCIEGCIENSDDNVSEPVECDSHIDCNEDPVDFEVPPLHKFESVSMFSKRQKDALQDIVIKKGKFTDEEDKIIKRNYKEFTKRYGISDPFELFGIGRYSKDPELLKFIRAKHFYIRLAKNLDNRTLNSVYKRARIILHPYRNGDRLSEKELTSIEKLHKVVHNKWQHIGNVVGRSADNCLQGYRWHDKAISKGKFLKEEEEQLIEAIKKVSGSSDLSYEKLESINWDAVAALVPTRNFSQCRMYWANHFAWAPNSLKKKWDKNCYVKLVNILNKEWNVDNSSMIDWHKVNESFKDFAPSPLFLQFRFSYLKSQVPDHKNKSYKDIIRILCRKYPASEIH